MNMFRRRKRKSKKVKKGRKKGLDKLKLEFEGLWKDYREHNQKTFEKVRKYYAFALLDKRKNVGTVWTKLQRELEIVRDKGRKFSNCFRKVAEVDPSFQREQINRGIGYYPICGLKEVKSDSQNEKTYYVGNLVRFQTNENELEDKFGIVVTVVVKEGSGIGSSGKTKFIVNFVGEYRRGKVEGKGRIYDPDRQRIVFEGMYQNGKKSGFGKYYEPSNKQVVFEGEFLNGKKHGRGLEYTYCKVHGEMVNMVTFRGFFKNGKKEGEGEMFDLRDYTRGNWKNDVLDPKSVYKFNLPFVPYESIKSHLTDSCLIQQGRFGRTIYRVKKSLIPSLRNLVGEEDNDDDDDYEDEEEYVAVKIMKMESRLERVFLRKKIETGFELLSRIGDKKNILSCYAMIGGDSNEHGEWRKIGYIMEICKLSIEQTISGSAGVLPIQQKIRILHETAKGVREMHRKSICHRDLKWGNILMNSELDVKICDFETLSEDKSSWDLRARMMTSMQGTVGFMAPEITLGKSYGLSIDIYSFGIMIYSLLFERNSPYSGTLECPKCKEKIKNAEKVTNIDFHVANHNLRPFLDEEKYLSSPNNPVFLLDLMKQCWSPDPYQRPSFEDIVEIFETEERKERKKYYSVIELEFQSYGDLIPNQRMLLVHPSVKKVIEWIENKFEGSKVVELRRSETEIIQSDEDILKMIDGNNNDDETPKIIVKLDKVDEGKEVFVEYRRILANEQKKKLADEIIELKREIINLKQKTKSVEDENDQLREKIEKQNK